MDERQRDEFIKLAEPLMKWISENGHPHMHALIDNSSAQLVEGLIGHVNDSFVRD